MHTYIDTYIHRYIHTYIHTSRYINTYILKKKKKKNIHTYIHTYMCNKEAGGGAQGAQSLSKICTSRESVSPLARLIEVFVTSIIDPPSGGSMRVA